ncbi:MORN-repeat protein [Orpheovirus IHUMI-LCC2]|uniref:MORN-repeat protein n=1 Tax=Orpheovirus IHUMI-LCC2 TaxID=2023057 RepID=A0A2I2L547_9VIRU|nr:MORN-repeat protein [Orpheovirus IHUMI-LCC2]SNW62668.1 MORN-repeat protein [Orpheovirus IHUMI-LCC2]
MRRVEEKVSSLVKGESYENHYYINEEGKKHGEFLSYYINKDGVKDKLRMRSNYLDGKVEGRCQTYYKNGKEKCICYYKNDLLHGLYLARHENGMMALWIEYRDGRHDGRYDEWDDTGHKKYEWRYKYGNRDGICLTYEKGRLHVEDNYVDGVNVGYYIWDCDGTLLFYK